MVQFFASQCSYIVRILKIKDSYSKSLMCDDFRGIAISLILSKTFEHCILFRFQTFLLRPTTSSDLRRELAAVLLFVLFVASLMILLR